MNSLHNLKGEQKDQLLITVDKNGTQIGTASRHNCHFGDGKTHLAFMGFVVNNRSIVLTRRSDKKSLWAGFWDTSVVSHVLPGETVEDAAHRRGKQELGIDVKFEDKGAFFYFAKHGESAENEFCHVLIGKTDQEVHPNSVEISEIKKMKLSKLKDEIISNPGKFTPWLLIAFKKIDLENYL